MEKTGGHKRPLKVMAEPKRTLAHKVHPFLRSLAGWFLMGVFDTFTEPMFSAIHNVLCLLYTSFSNVDHSTVFLVFDSPEAESVKLLGVRPPLL